MPYLGDFLGHLLSEITISRVQADLEAVRLAELYARDPILKHFPVPRFRLPTLTMRVPVAVHEMEQAPEGQPPRGRVEARDVRPAIERAVQAQLRQSGIRLSRSDMNAVQREVVRRLATIADFPEVAGGVSRVATEIAGRVASMVKDASPELEAEPEKANVFESELRERVATELVKVRQPPPRLTVLVTAAELREAGPNVVSLEISISEEAVVWTTIETAGRSADRLVEE